MSKQLVLIILVSLPCLARTKAEQAADVRTEIQHLWNSTGALTREYLIDVTLDLPKASSTTNHLLKNQKALGNLFEPLYGKEKTNTVSTLLTKQATLTIALIDATKKNDEKALKETTQAWKKNACAISSFFDKTNPYIHYKDLNTLLLDYLSKLTTMTNERIQKQWDQDLIAYDAVREQLHKIISLVGKALTDAFPKPKEKEPAHKPKVTVPLPPGTNLRKAV